MNTLLLIYVPIVASIAWSIYKTLKRGSGTDAIIVALVGAIVVTNGLARHFEICGYEPSHAIMMAQQIAGVLIVPLAYVYFSQQVNRPVINNTSVSISLVSLFVALPNITIVLSGHTANVAQIDGYKELTIVGEDIYRITIADFVIAMQTMIVLSRIVPLFVKLRKYGLEPSRDVKMFSAWWIVTSIFILFASAFPNGGETTNTICHIIFMVIVSTIFFVIGRGINITPAISNTKELTRDDALAEKLSLLIKEKQIHLNHEYSVDNAIMELGTNRTYFYHMVKAHFGCTFSELMNRERIKEAKHLLLSSKLPISHVAQHCGFNNTSYMIKIFKQLEGMTPTMWREYNNRQNNTIQ